MRKGGRAKERNMVAGVFFKQDNGAITLNKLTFAYLL